MAVTLQPNDRVLVNKMSYGPRLPISIFGFQFPYIRPFADQIKMDNVVLFNSPYQSTKPLDERDLLISRCVALPGDTVIWNGIDYKINEKVYQSSLNSLKEYIMAVSDTSTIQYLADDNGIELQWSERRDDSIIFKTSRAEASILMDENKDIFKITKASEFTKPIYLIVPQKGAKLKLSKNNIQLYCQILQYENGDNLKIEEDKIFINGILVDSYTFQEDYYWFLSDNVSNSIDSRVLGFIPFPSVVGKVSLILYNMNNMERFFKSVN